MNCPIPPDKWMSFSVRCLEMYDRYKLPGTTYGEDYEQFREDWARGLPEAKGVADQYQAYLVIKRLKA